MKMSFQSRVNRGYWNWPETQFKMRVQQCQKQHNKLKTFDLEPTWLVHNVRTGDEKNINRTAHTYVLLTRPCKLD